MSFKLISETNGDAENFYLLVTMLAFHTKYSMRKIVLISVQFLYNSHMLKNLLFPLLIKIRILLKKFSNVFPSNKFDSKFNIYNIYIAPKFNL